MAPSSLNCTLAIPAEPLAEAETVTALPLTVAPFAGAVIETDGAPALFALRNDTITLWVSNADGRVPVEAKLPAPATTQSCSSISWYAPSLAVVIALQGVVGVNAAVEVYT